MNELIALFVPFVFAGIFVFVLDVIAEAMFDFIGRFRDPTP